MKRYWDMDEAERAALSAEQVQDLLVVELMERGVLRPEEPELEDIEEPELETQRVYELSRRYQAGPDLVFRSAEDAQRVVELLAEVGAQSLTSRFPTYGLEAISVLEALPDLEISARNVIDHAQYEAHKTAIHAARSARARNKETLERYRKDLGKVETETADIWSDWRECRAAEAEREKVRATLEEYRQLTDGDQRMALRFLARAFSRELIEESIPGVVIPDDPEWQARQDSRPDDAQDADIPL